MERLEHLDVDLIDSLDTARLARAHNALVDVVNSAFDTFGSLVDAVAALEAKLNALAHQHRAEADVIDDELAMIRVALRATGIHVEDGEGDDPRMVQIDDEIRRAEMRADEDLPL